MTSCCSSISVQKSTKSEDQRSKSCDTVCTSNSSCYLQRRKPMNPLMYSIRPSYSKSTSSTVRQRVLSAKVLKLRAIQNQLNDANYHLSELTKENQILKNLQKRQDKALSKYENTNADLPRLLHCHEEQLRVLSEKNKSNRKIIRDLNDLIKTKEEELARVHEKLAHYEKVNKDKHLLDREKLTEQIEDMKLKLRKSDEEVNVLNRKLMLESKTAKQRLNSEMAKHKQTQKELSQALAEIDRLTSLLEAKENVIHPRQPRFSRLSQRSTMSMVNLGVYHPCNRSKSTDKLSIIEDTESKDSKTPVTDIKLEPIKCRLEEPNKKTNGILDAPSEAIKHRLSSGSTSKSRGSEESVSILNHSSGSENSLNGQDAISEVDLSCDDKDISRPTSGQRLEKIATCLDSAIQKATENTNNEFDRKLGDYCSSIMSNIRQSSIRLDAHKDSLKMSKNDTETLIETFQKTQNLESKLNNSLLNFEDDKSMSFINEILSEEMKFQNKKKDSNGNLKKGEALVNLEDKKKLLATLKAIDNGDSFESVSDSPTHKSNGLINEIFSSVSQ